MGIIRKTIKLILSLIVLILLRCTAENKSSETVNIEVNSVTTSASMDSFMRQVEFCPVKVKSDIYSVNGIRSLYIANDSLCFAIDETNALVCVNTCNGNIVSYKRKIGRAKNEVIMPNLITADDQNVYVWDGGKGCILIYDKLFDFKKSINMPYCPTNMIKVSSGFLCYSSGNETSVYLVAMDGRKKYSKYISEEKLDERVHSTFVKAYDRNVYFMSEYSDTIYRWNETEFTPAFYLDYKSANCRKTASSSSNPNIGRYTALFFVLPNHVLFSFYEDNVMRYGLFDRETGTVEIGNPKLPDGSAFTPFSQGTNTLLAVWDEQMLYALLDMSQEENKTIQLLIWRYTLDKSE